MAERSSGEKGDEERELNEKIKQAVEQAKKKWQQDVDTEKKEIESKEAIENSGDD